MCDLSYVNLLREKVRQMKAEEKHFSPSGSSSSEGRLVPWILPARSKRQETPEARTEAVAN